MKNDWNYFLDTTWKCYTITWCGWPMYHYNNLEKMKNDLEHLRKL